MIDVLIKQLDESLPLPKIANPGDAAVDIYSRVDTVIEAGQRALVPTGISIALPNGFAAFVLPRSGLALKHGISMVNAPGLIDSGYRGEISVILINHDPVQDFSISKGDRIAQLMLQEISSVNWHVVETLPGSMRGEGGFGSSGLKD
jgi:dUTP pyrophosphatase